MSEVSGVLATPCPSCVGEPRGMSNDPRPSRQRSVCACVTCGGLGQVVDDPDFRARVERIRGYWVTYDPDYSPHDQLAGVMYKALMAYMKESGELYKLYGHGLPCYAQQASQSPSFLQLASALQKSIREQVEELKGTRLSLKPELIEVVRAALVATLQGDLAEADRLFWVAFSINDKCADLRHTYGVFLAMFLGRYRDALPHFLEACNMARPPRAEFHLSTARCFQDLRRWTEVATYLKSATECPDFAELEAEYQSMVWAELENSDMEESSADVN